MLFIKEKFSKLNLEEFKSKFGATYDGAFTNSLSCSLYHVVFMIRRIPIALKSCFLHRISFHLSIHDSSNFICALFIRFYEPAFQFKNAEYFRILQTSPQS